MRVIAENSFHGTHATINVRDWAITPVQMQKLRRILCVKACTCFADHTIYRDPKSDNRLFIQMRADGGAELLNA